MSFAFCFICPLLWCAARVGQLFIAFCVICPRFASCCPSSERALRRRPGYHLPLVSLAHLYGARSSFSFLFCPIFPRYGAWPKQASLSLPFCAIFPPLWRAARPRSERSVGGPVIICLLFYLPIFMARVPSRPAFHCLSARLWRAARAGQLIIAFLCNLPPPPPVMARGPSSEGALRRQPS